MLDRFLDRKTPSADEGTVTSEQGAADSSQSKSPVILSGTKSAPVLMDYPPELKSPSVHNQPSSEPSTSPGDTRMSSSKSIKLQMWNPSQPTNPAP
jgi:hypothetical protein